MTNPRALVLLLMVLALVAAACTGGEDPAEDADADPTDATDVGAVTATASTDDDGASAPAGDSAGGIPLAPGVEDVDVEDDVLTAVAEWIDTSSGLSELLREEIFLSQVTRTRDVLHLQFVQQHGEVSVRGAQFVVHVRDTGEVLGASTSLVETLPGAGTAEALTAVEAQDIAEKAVPGTVTGESAVQATWLEVGAELRLGWDVLVATAGPPSNYTVIVDATTGDVLTVDRLAADHGHREGVTSARVHVPAAVSRAALAQVAQAEVAQAGSCDAPPAPSACIFVVDPIYASGAAFVDPAQANQTLVGVPLANLTDPGSGDLVGRYAQIAPQIAAAYNDPDGVHGQQGRGGTDITFESAMTYYWIDYTQQVVQEMGFDFHADDPVDFVPIEPEFPDNAFYLFTEDRIHMGIGGDGVNEAEDAQGIIHEYGHALLQAAVPNIVSEEGGAVHEGFADLVSVFTTVEFRDGDVGCLFHWAEQGECIRRIDTDLAYPDDLRFEVHLDGEIYTGAIWEVFVRVLERETGLTPEDCQDRAANPCDAVRDDVYATLLGSLPFLTPNLDLNDATAAFAVSDQTFFGGQNADVIAEVFEARGLSASGTPAVQIEGLMDFQASDSVLAVKVQHAYRGDLAVRLDVIDGAGEPRCAADLVTPDPDDDSDNLQGRFQLAGTDCEAYLPPGPDQVWLLTVTDTVAEDEGTLFQFSISHEGQRFLAAGLPAVIPDADQIGVTTAIGGAIPATTPAGGTTAPPPGPAPTPGATPAAGGTVTVDYAISHTYVGDLQVRVGVLDAASGEVLCRVDVRDPDPQDAGDVLSGTVDVSECAAFYPPSAAVTWALGVADVAAVDIGEVTAFTLIGPDGVVRDSPVPVAIPDDDQSGVVLPIAG